MPASPEPVREVRGIDPQAIAEDLLTSTEPLVLKGLVAHWPAVRAELAKINFTGWAAAEVKGGGWDYLADVSRRMDRVLDL